MPSHQVRTIRRRLRDLADPDKAAHAQRFFKTGPGEYGEGDVFLGIRVPALRTLAREHRDLPLADVVDLLRSPHHEERFVALVVLVHQFERGDPSTRKAIYRLYLENTDRIDNWDLVDTSAPAIVGGYLAERSRRPLYRLARSENLWERRIAMLATLPFIKRDEFADALALANVLLHDEHELLHKAVGWMLREIGNRSRSTEEAFLREHCRAMPRTMLRYAIEKFPEKRRKAYLAGTPEP